MGTFFELGKHKAVKLLRIIVLRKMLWDSNPLLIAAIRLWESFTFLETAKAVNDLNDLCQNAEA